MAWHYNCRIITVIVIIYYMVRKGICVWVRVCIEIGPENGQPVHRLLIVKLKKSVQKWVWASIDSWQYHNFQKKMFKIMNYTQKNLGCNSWAAPIVDTPAGGGGRATPCLLILCEVRRPAKHQRHPGQQCCSPTIFLRLSLTGVPKFLEQSGWVQSSTITRKICEAHILHI